jgi:hypothetical protein
MHKILSLSFAASTLLLADSNLNLLKKQMNEQQLTINKLEKKIKKIAIKKTKNETFGQSKYMPDISLITDFSYVNRSHKNDKVSHLEIPGVAHGILGSHSEGGVKHSSNNAKNGFNLNYAELALSSAVDPYFTLDSIFHITENGFEIEELYATTTALKSGIRIKGGKFLSDFGYLNNTHHHSWSFSDMPLVYESFLGSHGINEIGLQAQWVAPTSNYLMLGTEILQGKNKQMFGIDTIGDVENPIAKGVDSPSLFLSYVKASVDIGSTTVLGGLSYAKGVSRIDHSSDEKPSVFSGDSKLYGVDLLVKHYFDSYSYLSWQSEVLMREMKGNILTESVSGSKNFDTSTYLTKQQNGLYSQLEYRINSNWKTAVRYDTFLKNDVSTTDTFSPVNLNKYSVMGEYRTSEFTTFRLQYNCNEALYNEDGEKQKIDTVMFQVNFAIGAHSGHSF